jgi:hypothetical protein
MAKNRGKNFVRSKAKRTQAKYTLDRELMRQISASGTHISPDCADTRPGGPVDMVTVLKLVARSLSHIITLCSDIRRTRDELLSLSCALQRGRTATARRSNSGATRQDTELKHDGGAPPFNDVD